MGDLDSWSIANVAFAFATVVESDVQLFTALARVAKQRVDDFLAQEASKTVWAFAKAVQMNAKLFTSMASVAERRNFSMQQLAKTAWASATAKALC